MVAVKSERTGRVGRGLIGSGEKGVKWVLNKQRRTVGVGAVIVNQTKHVNKTLYAPTAPSTNSGSCKGP